MLRLGNNILKYLILCDQCLCIALLGYFVEQVWTFDALPPRGLGNFLRRGRIVLQKEILFCIISRHQSIGRICYHFGVILHFFSDLLTSDVFLGPFDVIAFIIREIHFSKIHFSQTSVGMILEFIRPATVGLHSAVVYGRMAQVELDIGAVPVTNVSDARVPSLLHSQEAILAAVEIPGSGLNFLGSLGWNF